MITILPSTALLLACFLDHDQSALRARDSTGDTNKVTFDIDMTNMSHGKNVTPAAHVADGRYAANLTFMMPGPWRLIVAVQRGGQQLGTARFDFNVNMR